MHPRDAPSFIFVGWECIIALETYLCPPLPLQFGIIFSPRKQSNYAHSEVLFNCVCSKNFEGKIGLEKNILLTGKIPEVDGHSDSQHDVMRKRCSNLVANIKIFEETT